MSRCGYSRVDLFVGASVTVTVARVAAAVKGSSVACSETFATCFACFENLAC